MTSRLLLLGCCSWLWTKEYRSLDVLPGPTDTNCDLQGDLLSLTEAKVRSPAMVRAAAVDKSHHLMTTEHTLLSRVDPPARKADPSTGRDHNNPGCQKSKRSDILASLGLRLRKVFANLSCLVCGALHMSEVMLVKHAWSHGNDPGSVCGACGERSESVEVLKDHLQSRHKTDDCHICGESFLSALSLDEHVACHSGEKPYKCDVCHNEFALKASLEDHRKLHEEGKRHKCHTCHKVFELKEQLKAHHRTHTNRKTHLCGVCGKSLCDYRSLSRHKMTHSGERPHSCKICGRRFKLPGTLRQHEKIHTNRERSYLCDICCKMFLTSAQLEIHMRIHTNEKPYHCSECGKGFSTKGPLTVHKRVHSGETPYHCPDCGWSFKRKTNLDNHLVLHSGIKPFVCGICGKACARKEYLTVHMRTHNGERPYKCTLCDKAFTQSHCLKNTHEEPPGARICNLIKFRGCKGAGAYPSSRREVKLPNQAVIMHVIRRFEKEKEGMCMVRVVSLSSGSYGQR
ncbi:gastrula zinc finger protein XlCGF46.1-like [Astatotilapia calliptera]|uniref:gastrula zinc finger protein XlCGF46.1-like n=1 Tax=Astatotilapia calliptera TaxID=8154 RepID=UPI000E40A300|nr:gastrula zinc finger protein XlCGF46.1-like [Astatotilapia calliptera]